MPRLPGAGETTQVRGRNHAGPGCLLEVISKLRSKRGHSPHKALVSMPASPFHPKCPANTPFPEYSQATSESCRGFVAHGQLHRPRRGLGVLLAGLLTVCPPLFPAWPGLPHHCFWGTALPGLSRPPWSAPLPTLPPAQPAPCRPQGLGHMPSHSDTVWTLSFFLSPLSTGWGLPPVLEQ